MPCDILGGASCSAFVLAGAFHTAMRIVYSYDRVRELRRLGALGSGPVRRGASKRKTSRCVEEEPTHKGRQEKCLATSWARRLIRRLCSREPSRRPPQIVVPQPLLGSGVW